MAAIRLVRCYICRQQFASKTALTSRVLSDGKAHLVCSHCQPQAQPVEDDDLTEGDITAIDAALAQPDMGPYTVEELEVIVEAALHCQECGKAINAQEQEHLGGICEDCYTGNVDVSDEAQEALQAAWDSLQDTPSYLEQCSAAFREFCEDELEREARLAFRATRDAFQARNEEIAAQIAKLERVTA